MSEKILEVTDGKKAIRKDMLEDGALLIGDGLKWGGEIVSR
jgi:hypothetical protein